MSSGTRLWIASNKELIAMNEKLQSINEVPGSATAQGRTLDAGRAAMNAELQQTREALTQARTDLKNLRDHTHVAAIFLDHDLRLTMFTPAITEIVHVVATDVGRPIAELAWSFQDGALPHDIERVLQTRQVAERTLFLPGGKGYTMRIFPCQTVACGPEGVGMTFADITLHQQMQQQAEGFARQLFNVVRLGMHALGDVGALAVMDEAVRIVQDTLEVDICGIFEYLPEAASLCLQTGYGWPAAHMGQATIAAAPGSLGNYILQRAEPVVFADLSQDTRFDAAPLLLDQGVMSGMGVVIHNQGQPYGILGAYTTRPRPFTPNDGFFLHTIAHVLTMALHRKCIAEERRREQLQRAERLASIGTLAAGIAHEMNNPLNTVMLSADHALSLLPPESPQSQDEIASALRDILQETERCGTIIRNISRFTCHETTHKEPQDLNAVVQRFVQLSPAYLSRPSLPLTYIPGDHIPPVVLNATEIEHILAHLVENALNAADDVRVTLCTEFDGLHVRLLVQDDGPGIRQEDLSYIFDPFYSTRRQRGGMGLGLSIVHAIVTDHQGTIHVLSQPPQHTIFAIMLPPVDAYQAA